jgi:thiol-disulfide isomerase/thioredoxin
MWDRIPTSVKRALNACLGVSPPHSLQRMKILLSLLTTAILSVSTLAADKKDTVPSATLADFKVGELITGPAVDLTNTGGKAVVIEAWGVNCGPCLASLPEMERMSKRNRADTIVIGAHSQNATDDQVKEVVKKNRLSYSIVKGVRGPVNFSGIPHAFVFDTTGALVFSGHPGDKDFDSAVRKAGRPAVKK